MPTKNNKSETSFDFVIVDPSEVPPARGRGALSAPAKVLLEGSRIFMNGDNHAARFVTMAKARGFRVRSRVGERAGVRGTYIWLEKLDEPPQA